MDRDVGGWCALPPAARARKCSRPAHRTRLYWRGAAFNTSVSGGGGVGPCLWTAMGLGGWEGGPRCGAASPFPLERVCAPPKHNHVSARLCWFVPLCCF